MGCLIRSICHISIFDPGIKLLFDMDELSMQKVFLPTANSARNIVVYCTVRISGEELSVTDVGGFNYDVTIGEPAQMMGFG